jgi:histidine ammonia-lyase
MIIIDGNQLTLDELIRVARDNEPVSLDNQAKKRMEKSWGWVESINSEERPVYGINTGFGIFSDKKISRADTATLSRNLILSHSVGMGESLPEEVVRAAMLVRANTLAKGFSGVRPIIVETFLAMLNKGVTPVVPSQGSMGSSGDLGPLSHLALVISTDKIDDEKDSGFALFNGEVMPGKWAMAAAGINRIILGPKEGLALNNGATFSASIGAIVVYDATRLYHLANISLSMTLEALQGLSAAFDSRIHQARGQIGQIQCAEEIRDLINGSTLINSSGRIQDAYSLRCAPQVHGAVWDAIEHVTKIIEREINAATDNPLLFSKDDALSGGNFHGEPVGIALDYLTIAMAEIGAISERRIFRLTDGNLNDGLPSMLVDSQKAAGLNSGLMMPQYTAASLVLENQTLSTPDSVHSLPTSGDQEDHNANSMTAARHSMRVLTNCWRIIAIELFTASRAIDLRLRMKPQATVSKAIADIHAQIRKIVPYQADDRCWGQDIEKVFDLIYHANINMPNLGR